MVSVMLLITFQNWSTAFTVALTAVPAVRGEGEPVFPEADPGAAVSPGISSCTFVKAVGMTEIGALVLAAIPGCVTSEAVTVRFPAARSVTLNEAVPAESAALGGSIAF